MKSIFFNPIKKSLQIVLLLAILLFNFGFGNISVAHAIDCYTLTLTTTTGGTITADPPPNCNSNTQYTFNTAVVLTAVPDSGYGFGVWSGNTNNNNTNPTPTAPALGTIYMVSNKSVTAFFFPIPSNDNLDGTDPNGPKTISSLPYTDSVDTKGANTNGDGPSIPAGEKCDGPTALAPKGGKNVWYKYVADSTKTISIDSLESTPPPTPPFPGITNYDSYIVVWEGTDINNLVFVKCNDNRDTATKEAQTLVNVTSGNTYYFEFSSFRGYIGFTNPVYGGTLNIAISDKAHIETYINNALQTPTLDMLPKASTKASYLTVNNGPVKVISTNGVPILSAERVIYNVNGVGTSFSEMMAMPSSQLSTTYWLPWYNNVDLDTQLRFGNVSGSTATVHVFIGGTEVTPLAGITLLPGASTRVSYAGVNNGPVQIVSDQNIVAAERVIYMINSVPVSFSEMMAMPSSQLSTTYWLPWYNNVDLDTQLRLGNVSGSTATVHVFIGGTEVTPLAGITLLPGASTRVSYVGVNNGPVQIVSNQNIVAAERVIYKINNALVSFSEMMAMPNSQLDKTYTLPWYNNVDLDTQLRFGNVSASTATVHVFIGGTEMTGSPFSLLTGQSTRLSYAGVNNGPVKVTSDVNIVMAERVIYKINNTPTSFSEMMGLPNSLLTTTYWLPWYNNVDLDTQLRYGVP